jgi:hypothetical protein
MVLLIGFIRVGKKRLYETLDKESQLRHELYDSIIESDDAKLEGVLNEVDYYLINHVKTNYPRESRVGLRAHSFIRDFFRKYVAEIRNKCIKTSSSEKK